MISFSKASLKRKPGEKERLSPRIEITLASLPPPTSERAMPVAQNKTAAY